MQMQGNDLAMKLMRMWNEGKLELADEVFTSDYRSHTTPQGFDTLEGQKQSTKMFMDSFSDMHFESPFSSMDGDMMMMRFEGTGRHTGEFMGMQPTNKLVCMGGVSIMRVRDGKVCESWDYFDMMGLAQQVGALPAMDMGGMGEGGQMGMGGSQREAA